MENLRSLLSPIAVLVGGVFFLLHWMRSCPSVSLFCVVWYSQPVELRLELAETVMLDWYLSWAEVNCPRGEVVKLALAK